MLAGEDRHAELDEALVPVGGGLSEFLGGSGLVADLQPSTSPCLPLARASAMRSPRRVPW